MKIITVTTESQLDACISELEKHDQLGLDLEFDKNLHRYGFNICLIQIQAGNTSFLIDPLSKDMNFRNVFPILEDPQTMKVVFAFGEDLRLLNSLSCYPKNIYDINIATRLLNFEPGSLSRYLNEVLLLEVTKSAQLSNWFTRPLKETQIKYAAEDVQYLISLKEVLTLKANKKSITSWIEEENKILDDTRYDIDYDTVHIKEKDKKGLSEHQWHLLKNLLQYREDLAKKINKPSFQVMNMDFLKDFVHDTDKIHQWDMAHGVIKTLRNERVKKKFIGILENTNIESEQLNLSKSTWATKKHSPEEHKIRVSNKKKLDELKKSVFKPIQNLIKRDYGEHAATYIFSNKIMQKLVMEGPIKETIHQLPAYKLTLLQRYAKELSIDLNTLD